MIKRGNNEINAGSMADIAFLLLIFFLVTTTMDTDTGIIKKLPEKLPENVKVPKIKEKNILEISINHSDELLVNEKEVQIGDIKKLAIDFIDNGGGVDVNGNPCDYCEGKKLSSSSDHPSKAIISIQTSQATSYGMYISVQNELLSAYIYLKNRYAKKYLTKKFKGFSYSDLLKMKKNDDINAAIKEIKKAYPEILSDAEPIKLNHVEI